MNCRTPKNIEREPTSKSMRMRKLIHGIGIHWANLPIFHGIRVKYLKCTSLEPQMMVWSIKKNWNLNGIRTFQNDKMFMRMIYRIVGSLSTNIPFRCYKMMITHNCVLCWIKWKRQWVNYIGDTKNSKSTEVYIVTQINWCVIPC